tara:strand:- start:15 stop:1310 length:1296 start_codon:yes stop_codon:yes gene_type:complete
MEITFQQAVTAHQEGNLEEAERLYLSLLDNNPKNLDAYNNLGGLLFSIGRFNEAEACYKKVIVLKPDYAEAHNNLGVLLFKLGKLDISEISCKKAIKLKPDYEDAYYNLGNVLRRLERLDEAEVSYRKAIELKLDYAEAYNNLGSILSSSYKYDEAEINYKNAIKYKPFFVEAHCNLGALKVALGKLDEAEVIYKKAVELKPDNTEAKKNLTSVLTYNLLLSQILQTKNNNNEIKLSFMKKLYIKLFGADLRLDSYPFFSKRKVEGELITYLYKISSMVLDKTDDARFGNGTCSNFNFLKDDSPIIKNLAKDLINIMEHAVKSKIFISESFFNIIGSGSGATIHCHDANLDKVLKLSDQKYSFFYYVSLGNQNCSEPGILKLYNNDGKKITKEILPSKGKIIITRADQLHSVAYNGKEDRIMIGVNFYSLL